MTSKPTSVFLALTPPVRSDFQPDTVKSDRQAFLPDTSLNVSPRKANRTDPRNLILHAFSRPNAVADIADLAAFSKTGGVMTTDATLPRSGSPDENVAWTADITAYGSIPLRIVPTIKSVATSTAGENKRTNYHVSFVFQSTPGLTKNWASRPDQPVRHSPNTPMVSEPHLGRSPRRPDSLLL